MGSILTSLIYFSAAVFIMLTFLGAGRPIYQKLTRGMELPESGTGLICQFILGFCALDLFSVLLFSYLPASWAMTGCAFFMSLFLCWGVWSEVSRLKGRTDRRITLLSWAFFAGSFTLAYLPFVSAQKIFLASEGGGDITGYLGFTKVLLNQLMHPEVAPPRFLITARSWLEEMGLVTVPRPRVYAEIDPALIGFYNDLPATIYNPTAFFLALRFIFPVEVIYLTLWTVVTAMVPLIAAFAIPPNLKRAKLWRVLAFLLLTLSSGFQSVFLNHYMYQLLSVFMIASLYFGLTRLVAFDPVPRPKWAIVVLTLMVVSISYFPGTAPSLIFAGWGAALLLLARHWRNSGQPIFPSISLPALGWVGCLLLLLFPLLYEPIFRHIGIIVPPKDPKELEISNAVWGPPVHAFQEMWNGLQGTMIHNLAQPYTSLSFDKVWNYRLALGSILVLILCLLPVLRVLSKSWRSPREFWQSYLPVVIFAFGSFLMIPVFLVICNVHTYVFDKMAMLTLPVTMVSLLILLAAGLSELSGRLRTMMGTLAAVFILSWLVGNMELRFYQVRSFYSGLNRTGILYTQDYLHSLPIKDPSRIFLYSHLAGSGTTYYLMEASMSGLGTFPANNYFHANYPSFLAKIDFTKANYVIAKERGAEAFDVSHFYLGHGRDFALPIDPTVNPDASDLPRRIVIDRFTPEGTGIVLQASQVWKVRCHSFAKEACQLEEADMGFNQYHRVKGQRSADGSYVFQTKVRKGLQVLRFKQAREIVFELARG